MQNFPAYFISDAHLGVNPPGAIESREETLVRFLEALKGKASHVFFVGDLFEFWYEYRHYVARKHFPLYRILGDLVDSGVSVHLIRGNHDFALDDFFPKELGVQVHSSFVFETQGHRIYLMHGDGIPKSDRGYRLARKLIDAKWARFLFRKIHPDLGMDIAQFVGRNSRKAGASREIQIEEYLAAASKKCAKIIATFACTGIIIFREFGKCPRARSSPRGNGFSHCIMRNWKMEKSNF